MSKPKSKPIRILGNRVLLEPSQKLDENAGGILIPDAVRGESPERVVAAVGTLVKHVKKGDRVIVSRFAGSELKLAGVVYTLLVEEEILAVFN